MLPYFTIKDKMQRVAIIRGAHIGEIGKEFIKK